MEQQQINFNAIRTIKPDGEFVIEDTYESLYWFDHNTEVKPTEKEFNDAVTAWQANYDAQEYARKREAEYPSTGDQLDYIFHNGVAKWKTDMIEPVKAKYPKPS